MERIDPDTIWNLNIHGYGGEFELLRKGEVTYLVFTDGVKTYKAMLFGSNKPDSDVRVVEVAEAFTDDEWKIYYQ